MLRDTNTYAYLQNLIPHVTLESEKSGTRVVHSHELETVLELKDKICKPNEKSSGGSLKGSLCLPLGSKVNVIT